jgi:hypothetical protein
MSYLKSFLMVTLGLGFLGVVIYKLPVVELFTMFALIVGVPLGMLASIGLIGQGSLDFVRNFITDFGTALKANLEAKYETIRQEAAAS